MKSGRSLFNEAIADARRKQPGFDVPALSSWLTGPFASLAETVPRFTDELASAGLDVSIMLVAHGLISGPGYSQFHDLWAKVLSRCPELLSTYPRETLGIFHNAALNIRSSGKGVFSRWIDSLDALTDQVKTLPDLKNLCSVLAWTSGLAPYRISALEAAEKLPKELAHQALSVSSSVDIQESIIRFRENRWYNPKGSEEKSLKVIHEVGAFTGFNGKFTDPPSVRACNDYYAVKSGNNYYTLCADTFGAVLLGGSESEYSNAMEQTEEIPEGLLSLINLPEEGLSMTCSCDSIAVFSPWSYTILLISLPGSSKG
jgi:hypothetical protein